MEIRKAMTCIQCNQVPVNEEFQRCGGCQTAHEELVKKLDIRPKPIKKPKEELVAVTHKKMLQYPDGMKEVEFTDYYTKEDCLILGIPIPK